jgi:C-8 sterol isomerase
LAQIVTNSLATHGASNASSDTSALVELVVEGIAERYPNTRVKTNFRNRDEWMFNNAGGAMGSMFLIHASLTEYVLGSLCLACGLTNERSDVGT